MAQIKGIAQVIRNLSRIEKDTVRNIVDATTAVQAQVINDAKNIVPVVTGNLRGSIQAGSITVRDEGIEAIVLANAEYASFVEFGTSRQRAQPYLTPALHGNMQTFRRAIAEATKR